ncbi:MAG: hypothetical protein L6V93_16900 [Clostridiales bacterium]|nr:MAG: hypothetical protein L6V93_16900 [Clostridiales bacterium]
MLDINKIKERCEGIVSVGENNGKITVDTLYDGKIELDRNDYLSERCVNCKSKKMRCVRRAYRRKRRSSRKHAFRRGGKA